MRRVAWKVESLTAFPPSRAEALRRLSHFLPRAGRIYANERNADLGPDRRENVSNLSPYLRYRLITERQVVAAVLGRHSADDAAKFVQEVCWRTYWKGWLEMHPEVWSRFESERDAAREAAGSGLTTALEAAESGTTGIEGFDDWATELVKTGYMHNHARMWFASIWIFTLRLPWTLGADFFLRHLIDADPASNTLSWRWVAGLQTHGKTYLATADNIARYTAGRYQPKGLAVRADALEEAPLPAIRPLPPVPPLPARPTLILMTGEDLNPESLFGTNTQVRGIIAVRGIDAWPHGNLARAFVSAAVTDGADRAGRAFNASSDTIDTFDSAKIAAAARAAGVTDLATAYAPVGPVADALVELAAALQTEGLTLTRKRRSWDDRFWLNATKGYFKLRENIPEVLASEGLRL